eukprot:15076685-Alexandrium_andersonii.AAC.1
MDIVDFRSKAKAAMTRVEKSLETCKLQVSEVGETIHEALAQDMDSKLDASAAAEVNAVAARALSEAEAK